MGTPCRIVLYAPVEEAAIEACRAAFARISEIEAVLSDYRVNSEVSRLSDAQAGIWHPVSDDLAAAMVQSVRIHRASAGAFDPTLGALTKLWRQARRSGQLSSPEQLERARSRAGLEQITFDAEARRIRMEVNGVGFDFGGIGKGIGADEAMAVLRQRGIRSALIDFGGDLLASEPPPGRGTSTPRVAGWRVAT